MRAPASNSRKRISSRRSPGIEAQHVVREGRELAEQLDTDEAAADHDDRQAPATRRRLRGRIGALELLDQVVSQHQRVRHRLERERVRRAGNQLLVRGRAERHDEMVVRQVVASALRRRRLATIWRSTSTRSTVASMKRVRRSAARIGCAQCRSSNLPEQASNRSGVRTKKFSRLTSVISTPALSAQALARGAAPW